MTRVTGHRSRRVPRKAVIGVLSAACAVALIAGPALARWPGGASSPGTPAGTAAASACGSPGLPPAPYLGVVASGLPSSTAGLTSFTAAAGAAPQLVSFYVSFGSAFDNSAVCGIVRRGAVPVVQIDPGKTSVAAIAAGQYDRYLTGYARAVRAARSTVVLSFGHEMNGYWYDWGYPHVPPATFVRAWRVIHQVFARAGARNVVWLWTVNRDGTGVLPPRDYWPGAAYVTWVGIDAYYWTGYGTFGTVVEPTITDVRSFTTKPILIAETAVTPGPSQASQITALFAAVKAAPYLLGLIWFDINARSQWQIEGDQAATAAFRAAMPDYLPRLDGRTSADGRP
jgi:mannan endo-1,4-beta-mannosidase